MADFCAHFEFAHRFANAEWRKHALQQRVDCGDHQLIARFACLQPVQCRQPLRADRHGRAGPVKRQAIPRRKFDHLQFGGEEMRRIHHCAHCRIIGRDENRAAPCSAGEVGEDQRLRSTRHAGEGERLLSFQNAGKIGHRFQTSGSSNSPILFRGGGWGWRRAERAPSGTTPLRLGSPSARQVSLPSSEDERGENQMFT